MRPQVIFPAVTAVKANNAAPHEQGAVQGAIFGARSVAMGIGPLVFAAMFAAFTRPEEQGSVLPFLPQAPFLAAMVLIALGLALSLTLPRAAAGGADVPVVGPAGTQEEGAAAPGAAGDEVGAAVGGADTGQGRGRFFWGGKTGKGRTSPELSRPLLAEFEESDERDEDGGGAGGGTVDGEAGAEGVERRPSPVRGEPGAAAPAPAAAAVRRGEAEMARGLVDGDMEAGDGRHLIHPA